MQIVPQSKTQMKDVASNGDFDEVDDSEISGEERPHDNINMIPNSQVARPQEGMMNTSMSHAQN